MNPKYKKYLCLTSEAILYMTAATILMCLFFQKLKPPMFSLILSVYNYERFVPQMLDSVLASTDRDFELIVINDGSTDNSLNVIRSYAEKDNRIRVINQENQGLSAARNNGIQIARGDYLWFIDADDMIDKNALSALRHMVRTHHPDMITIYTQRTNENATRFWSDAYCRVPSEVLQFRNRTFSVDDLSFGTIINYPVSSVKQIYRRAFIQEKGIDFPNGTYFEDNVFFQHTLFAGAKTVVLPRAVYTIRHHSHSLIANRNRIYDSYLRIIPLIHDRIIRAGTPRKTALRLVSIYWPDIFSRWDELTPDQKKRFLPDLKQLSAWIAQIPPDEWQQSLYRKLDDFIRKVSSSIQEADS